VISRNAKMAYAEAVRIRRNVYKNTCDVSHDARLVAIFKPSAAAVFRFAGIKKSLRDLNRYSINNLPEMRAIGSSYDVSDQIEFFLRARKSLQKRLSEDHIKYQSSKEAMSSYIAQRIASLFKANVAACNGYQETVRFDHGLPGLPKGSKAVKIKIDRQPHIVLPFISLEKNDGKQFEYTFHVGMDFYKNLDPVTELKNGISRVIVDSPETYFILKLQHVPMTDDIEDCKVYQCYCASFIHSKTKTNGRAEFRNMFYAIHERHPELSVFGENAHQLLDQVTEAIIKKVADNF
jgi:hypothetical protein